MCRPYRACCWLDFLSPGRCPGLVCCGPFGAKILLATRHQFQITQNTRKRYTLWQKSFTASPYRGSVVPKKSFTPSTSPGSIYCSGKLPTLCFGISRKTNLCLNNLPDPKSKSHNSGWEIPHLSVKLIFWFSRLWLESPPTTCARPNETSPRDFHAIMAASNELVLIFDFGSQFGQLIARRVRELNVFCQVVRHDLSAERIKELNPKGIIFSGGPASVSSPTRQIAIPACSTSVSPCWVSATGCNSPVWRLGVRLVVCSHSRIRPSHAHSQRPQYAFSRLTRTNRLSG